MYYCGITGIYIRHLTIVSWLSFAVTHLNSMHTRLGQGRDAFTKRLKSDRQQWDMRLTRGILNISKFQGNAHLSDFRDLWFNSFGGVLPLALGYNHISANCLHITLYQRGRVWWQCTGNHYLELYMTNSQSPSHQVPHIWARIKGSSLHLIQDARWGWLPTWTGHLQRRAHWHISLQRDLKILMQFSSQNRATLVN